MSEKRKKIMVPQVELEKAMQVKTIFGNIATIKAPHIQEMCWYCTGYTRIVTSFGEYIIRQGQDEFERMQQELRTEI